jgi:zinc ribbon protein
MYCKKCGKPIPDDSDFCNKCGAPQRVGLSAATTETSWETGRIRCKAIKEGRFFFGRYRSNFKCMFVLEAIGPKGSYTAETSPEFEYYWADNPSSDGEYSQAIPFYVFVKEYEGLRQVFDGFVAQITTAGWEPVPRQDSYKLWSGELSLKGRIRARSTDDLNARTGTVLFLTNPVDRLNPRPA